MEPQFKCPAPRPPSASPSTISLASTPAPECSDSSAPRDWSLYYDDRRVLHIPASEGIGEDCFVVYTAGKASGPVLILLHGGGLSAMSFALAAQAIKRKARVVAFDFRGHGATVTTDDGDLSRDRLVGDVVRVVAALYGDAVPPLVLVGHSLGGAIAIWTAAIHKELPIVGLVVIDVVEGSALDSLPHMISFLDSRPSSFFSLPRAIEWATAHGGMRNGESARVSMPAQLVERAGHSGTVRWHWRTDLRASEPYWRAWFEGMSQAFLDLKGPSKLLLLAGTDRLDTALTVAHMQGQFQLGLIYGTGHYMMEDKPEETAQRLVDFHERLAKIVALNAALRHR
jgi:protein phosphatase methylesterase 1